MFIKLLAKAQRRKGSENYKIIFIRLNLEITIEICVRKFYIKKTLTKTEVFVRVEVICVLRSQRRSSMIGRITQ